MNIKQFYRTGMVLLVAIIVLSLVVISINVFKPAITGNLILDSGDNIFTSSIKQLGNNDNETNSNYNNFKKLKENKNIDTNSIKNEKSINNNLENKSIEVNSNNKINENLINKNIIESNVGYKRKKTDEKIKTEIISSKEIGDDLVVEFYHNSDKREPISVIGNVNYELSQNMSDADENVTLKIFDWNNHRFTLKVGADSDEIGYGHVVSIDDNFIPKLDDIGMKRDGDNINFSFKNNVVLVMQPTVQYKGSEYTISQIKNAYPNVKFKNHMQKADRWKWALNFSSIPEALINDTEYIIMNLISSSIDWSKTAFMEQNNSLNETISSQITFPNGMIIEFDDLLEMNYTVEIDKVNKRILVGNLLANYNSNDGSLLLDPTSGLLVNISLPLNNTNIIANSTFNLTANVTCIDTTGGGCGTVSGLARYNSSGGFAITEINTTQFAVPLFVNGSTGDTLNIFEADSSDWNSGTAINVTINSDNITLNINGSNQYPNQTGNFTSQVIDTGSDNSNFTFISWSSGAPYQQEIGRSGGDNNDATDEDIYINTSGLVLLMHFNNESGFGENDSLFRDYSPDVNIERVTSVRNNGTCTGATCPVYNFTGMKFGRGSLNMDGTNDIIDVPNDPSLDISATESFSLTMWAKVPMAGGSFLAKGSSGAFGSGVPRYDFRIRGTDDDRLLFYIEDSNGDRSGENNFGTTNITDNTWHFLAGTVDRSTNLLKAYVDGKEEVSVDISAVDSLSNGNDLSIAKGATVANAKGQLDEVAIWNRTLSPKEILDLYKRGALSLNLSVRSCNDGACSGEAWSEVLINESGISLNETITPINRFFQYRATFSNYNGPDDDIFDNPEFNLTPVLYNVTINYTNMNPLSCGVMSNNDQCQLNFTINASGDVGSVLLVDVNFSSNNSNIVSNDTEDHLITITGPPDLVAPIVNTTINKSFSNILNGDVINISANVTDETELSFCQVISNQTGINEIWNTSLEGLTAAECSNKTTITVGIGSVINFTIRVNDTSNNWKTNDTIITVADPNCDEGTTTTLCVINTIRGVRNNTVKYYHNLTIQNGGGLRNQTHTAIFNISAENIIIEDGGYIEGNVNINASNLTIMTGGLINSSGLGYNSSLGPGIGIKGSSQNGAGGGGYGGTGGDGENGKEGGMPYGSITQPVDFGSPGGGHSTNYDGGAGGGAIYLNITDNLNVSGMIMSNGENGTSSNALEASGGGSGGSIYIITGSFKGNGTLNASGGTGSDALNAEGGGGSGGRIAIYYDNNNYTGGIYAYGGFGPNTAQDGSAGTVYLKSSSESYGDLIIDNNNLDYGAITNITPTLTLDNLNITRKANVSIMEDTNLTAHALNISSSIINNFGNFTPHRVTSRAGTIINNNLMAWTNDTIFDISIENYANLNVSNNVEINYSGLTNRGNLSLPLIINVSGRIALDGFFKMTTLNVVEGGVLTHSNNSDTLQNSINISAANISIAHGAMVNITGMGYTSSSGPGQGTDGSVFNGGGGAGYGNLGGDGESGRAGGISYGSIIMPFDIGSGGGGSSGAAGGGSGGGGLFFNVSDTFNLSGRIAANGMNGTDSGGTFYSGGGGSGGSVLIATNTFYGNGTINASGGDGNDYSTASGGGGSGGRIAVYAKTNAFNGTILSLGGTGFRAAIDGYNGTNFTASNITVFVAVNQSTNVVAGQNITIYGNLSVSAYNLTNYTIGVFIDDVQYYINDTEVVLKNSSTTSSPQTNYSVGMGSNTGSFRYNLTVPDSISSGTHTVTVNASLFTIFGTNGSTFSMIDSTVPIVNTSLNKSISNINNGDVINISANVTDDVGLSYCQVISNQTSGVIEYWNKSIEGLTATECSNVTSIVNTAGYVINFTVRVNDSSGNWRTNDTIITVASADTCTYLSGDWNVDGADNCVISSEVDVGGNNIYIKGAGTFTVKARIYNYNELRIEGTDENNILDVRCEGACFED